MMSEQAYLSITTDSQLDEYCQQILANSDITWIAIDTEFVRVNTYFPELSLVQIQDNQGQAAMIDPVVIRQNSDRTHPFNSLVELLSSQRITKVFHSARQDIEVLFQLQGVMPVNIFDTQIAAIFKKHGDLAGFSRVIEHELGVILEKSQTRTDWHARPLSAQQIEYALDDVRYLAPLYEKYLDELTPAQLQAVQEEGEALLDVSLYRIDPEQAGQRIKNKKGLRGKGLEIVNRLAAWRERYAIEHNQPKKWIMSDDVIVQIAKRPPKTVQALYKVPNIKSSSVKEFGETWISLIDEVFTLPQEAYPGAPAKAPRASQKEETLLAFLQSYVHQVAVEYRLVSSHLVNKTQLLEMLRQPGQHHLSGWRRVLIGDDLNRLLTEKAGLKLIQGNLTLIET